MTDVYPMSMAWWLGNLDKYDNSNNRDNCKHRSHDWGFYLYSFIVSQTHEPNFTIYYSDGFEIITSWFPGFLLRNNVSLSLLARNACEDGISATEVRELILNGRLSEKGVVPESVYKRRETIKAFLNVFKN